MIELSDTQKRAIWDILVQVCGAHPGLWDQFNHHFPQCREFRFQGALGFGGKAWADRRRVYVDCYSEDETPERRELIGHANAQLADLVSGGAVAS